MCQYPVPIVSIVAGNSAATGYKLDVPNSTLAQDFQRVVQQILGKSDAELSHWNAALREVLGPKGQLMVNLLPELALIIGGPAPDLPPKDQQAHFQLVFRRFHDVLAQPEHPLALFLGDLQWLDADVGRPIADTLSFAPDCVAPLVRLVHERTATNLFSAAQFFTALAQEALLAFDLGLAAWTWELPRVRAKDSMTADRRRCFEPYPWPSDFWIRQAYQVGSIS